MMFLMRNWGGTPQNFANFESCISRGVSNLDSCALRLSQNSNFRLYRDITAQSGKPDETPRVITSNICPEERQEPEEKDEQKVDGKTLVDPLRSRISEPEKSGGRSKHLFCNLVGSL